jgi:hypothetical protein
MMYSEIIAVCSEIHTKHIKTLCGRNVGFVTTMCGCTQSIHNSFECSDCMNRCMVFQVTINFQFLAQEKL